MKTTTIDTSWMEKKEDGTFQLPTLTNPLFRYTGEWFVVVKTDDETDEVVDVILVPKLEEQMSDDSWELATIETSSLELNINLDDFTYYCGEDGLPIPLA